jgi:UDP-glucose 4-epimerase
MPSQVACYDPQRYIDVNITGTRNVLEYCRRVNVKKVMFTQSHSDVAGYWNNGKLIPSDCPRSIVYKGDHAVYIISKNAATDLFEHYHQEYGLQTVVFRLPTIYSYHPLFEMYVNGNKSIIAYRVLIKKAIAGEDLEIWGDPSRAKDIVYVKDFNQMVLKSLESEKAQGLYNVGTGIPTTLEQQIKGIAAVFCPKDKTSRIIYRPEKPSQNSYLYDISKAVDDFGYEPKYSYIEMLQDMKVEMTGHRFDHLCDMHTAL